MAQGDFVPLEGYKRLSDAEMLTQAREFTKQVQGRRSVRDFAPDPVPQEVIEQCLRAAITAPSGANRQPWHFCVASQPGLKRQIRLAAESAEMRFYRQTAPEAWLEAVKPLGTDWNKPFLETAPYLIAVFAQPLGTTFSGESVTNYYPTESVSIAVGLLLAALQHAGLASLVYTPSSMAFLAEIFKRPPKERALCLVVVGHPAQDAKVPNIPRKDLDEVCTWT